jgi:hypothetical protein
LIGISRRWIAIERKWIGISHKLIGIPDILIAVGFNQRINAASKPRALAQMDTMLLG